MAFNISNFRNAMEFDGQRPNLFEVSISNAAGDAFKGKSLEFFAKATSIPGATIGQVIVPYFGREVKFAGNRTFAEWTLTVINDETFAIRGNMENWMNALNTHETNVRNTGGSGSSSYVTNATVKQFGKTGTGNITAQYQFKNIFPTDISEITLDWGDNDTIEEFTVTFAYDFWTRTAVGASGEFGEQAPGIGTVS